MKSQKFFFAIAAVVVVLGVFFFFVFGIVKPRFQSAVERVGGVEVAAVAAVVPEVVDNVHGVNLVDSVAVVNPVVVDRVVDQLNVAALVS